MEGGRVALCCVCSPASYCSRVRSVLPRCMLVFFVRNFIYEGVHKNRGRYNFFSGKGEGGGLACEVLVTREHGITWHLVWHPTLGATHTKFNSKRRGTIRTSTHLLTRYPISSVITVCAYVYAQPLGYVPVYSSVCTLAS